jgi:hypothetical protein
MAAWSTGPRTAEGRARCARARLRHGAYSAATRALMAEARVHLRRMSALLGRHSTAGHGVLPSVSRASIARPVHPVRRFGFVQRTLLGGTALGLGVTIEPPVAAGHGVLRSFSTASQF